MTEFSPLTWWRRFLALPNDNRVKTLGVAFLVALISALTVSLTSVLLQPRQQAHIDAAREAKFAAMVATLPGLADILRETGAETLDTVIVDLAAGKIDETIDAASYDFLAAQTDSSQSTPLLPEVDLAAIKVRPNHAPVYLLRGNKGLALVVLPIYGAGYQSTLRAYLALEGDLNTVAGLSIYEQGETPGLGSRVTDPAWLAQWSGKQTANTAGEITISVVRGTGATPFEVDGIAGATRSTTGLSNLVRFWLGADGYGPFLKRLKSGDM
ncbi:NADH:ubiquinone reductase (Na(+)-transporting) subunit C [Falsihalocynthiibacter sp. S25ZX9]|uniref:NADH:ubiquinone reductase (Na(+)-transporting) subunit C n=1 Tax=unclassified Falsihalocynthiibacter TaxID=2854191 RepID=UPI0035105EC9